MDRGSSIYHCKSNYSMGASGKNGRSCEPKLARALEVVNFDRGEVFNFIM